MIKQNGTGDLRAWCQIGYDQTTLLKLRLSSIDVSFLGNEGTFIITPSDGNIIGKHFSNRDHDTMENLLMLPVFSHQNLIGLLIIADNPYFNSTEYELAMIFGPTQDLLRQIIDQHNMLTKSDILISEHILENYVNTHKIIDVTNVKVLAISIASLARLIHTDYPHNVITAVVLDLKNRIISLLQRQIDFVLIDKKDCYLKLLPELDNQLDIIRVSLLRELLATFGKEDLYDIADDFITLFDLNRLWKPS